VEKITTIKERVLLFAEKQEVSKQDFFKKTGLNYDNFKGKSKNTALGSDSIVDIFTTYPNLNLEWLIAGKGEMLKNPVFENVIEEPKVIYGKKPDNEIMLELIKQNRELQDKYADAREEIGRLKNKPKIKAESA